MKISNITNKTVEFFRNNGKRIVCTAALGITLGVPVEEALAEKDQKDANTSQTKVSQNVNYNNSISDEDIIKQNTKDNRITIIAKGKKTTVPANNLKRIAEVIGESVDEKPAKEEGIYVIRSEWRKSKNYSEDNREYYRNITKISPNDSFDPVYFNRKWENLSIELNEHPERISHMFDVLGTTQETIIVNKIQERNLTTQFSSLTVEGRDIVVYYQTKKDSSILMAVIVGLALGLILGSVIMISGK